MNKIIIFWAKESFITCSILHLHIGHNFVHNVHKMHVEMSWNGSNGKFESTFMHILQILWLLAVADFLYLYLQKYKWFEIDCKNNVRLFTNILIIKEKWYIWLPFWFLDSSNKRMNLQFLLYFLCSIIGSSWGSHLCRLIPQNAQVTISLNPG